MIKKYLKLLPLILILLSQLALAQQENHWSRIDAAKVRNSLVQRKAKVEKYAGFALNRAALTRDLENVPNRRSATSGSGRLMKFPDKDGKMVSFRVMESSVMEPGLASKYPNNKSYVGVSTDGTQQRIRFSINAMGFNAIIMGPDHTIQFIEPMTKDKMNYRVYDRNELDVESDFTKFFGSFEFSRYSIVNNFAEWL